MSRNTVHHDGAWRRAMRLLATFLLFGGMVTGPALHLAAEAVLAGTPCHASNPDGQPDAPPDTHHDCPVCVTLATAAPAVLGTAPQDHLARAHPPTALSPEPGDDEAVQLSRARAPPIE
jgi:hypothetical protein